MKLPQKPGGSPRRVDSRTVLVLLAVLGLQVVIVLVIVAVAFPDWRPAFLDGASREPALPGRLVAMPSAPDAGAPDVSPKPTDAAASRMLFGDSGRAVLGDQVPEAPRAASPGSSSPSASHLPPPPPGSAPAVDKASRADQLAFEQYLDWLRTVELERLSLRTWGEHHLSTGETLIQPDPAQRRQVLHLAGQEVSAFRQRILRTKPVVPADCRIVDQYFMGAIAQEGSQAADLLEALEQQDADRVRQLQHSGTGRIDRDLTVANAKLEQTLRKRGQPLVLRIETGVDASLLGALTELPAPH